MNLSDLITQKQGQPQLSKEEYAAMKKSEREAAWAQVDGQAEAVFESGPALQGFLRFMASCTPQSTRNLLLLYAQDPGIRCPRTFEKWKEAGRSVVSGAEGYTFFVEQEYQKEDGSRASGYALTKAFDISQTRGPQPAQPRQYGPEELLAAIVAGSPVRLEISGQLPKGVEAQYVPIARLENISIISPLKAEIYGVLAGISVLDIFEDCYKPRTIYVISEMDAATAFCAIAREQAHAGYDTPGRGYFRQAFAAQAYCAAYAAAWKAGVDTDFFRFDKVCEGCRGLGVQSKRGFLSDVKSAAYAIDRGLERSFREQEQARADSFSIGPGTDSIRPKVRTEPEAER